MKLDIKVTTWERLHIKDDAPQEFINSLAAKIQSGCRVSEIVDMLTDSEYYDEYCERLAETDEYMEPEDNEYHPTAELVDNEGKDIANNTQKMSSR